MVVIKTSPVRVCARVFSGGGRGGGNNGSNMGIIVPTRNFCGVTFIVLDKADLWNCERAHLLPLSFSPLSVCVSSDACVNEPGQSGGGVGGGCSPELNGSCIKNPVFNCMMNVTT